MIDALGTKYRGTGAPPEEVINNLLKVKLGAELRGLIRTQMIPVVAWLSTLFTAQQQGTPPSARIYPPAPNIRAIGLGDSLILAMYGSSELRGNLSAIGDILNNLVVSGMEVGLFFRGSVSMGEWSEMDPQVPQSIHVIGQAVDEAAEWRDRTEWIGVALTPRAGFEWETGPDFKPESVGEEFVRYPVPVKPGDSEETGVLRWALNWPRALDRDQLLRRLSAFPVPKAAARKYVNTLMFYDDVRRRMDKKG